MTESTPSQDSGPRYATPELHFVRKQVTLGRPDSDNKVEVSQLVRKGAVLADFPNYLQMKKRGFLRSPIEPGEFVSFDSENHALVAEVAGYPRATYVEQEDGPDTLIVTLVPAFKIAHDKMQANLVIHPAIPEAPSLKTEKLEELIEEEGISYGILENALKKAKNSIHAEYVDFDDIPIAKGTYPGKGEDAYLQFELEIGPLAGHLSKDGTIDFRDRKVMVGVKEGQHIATKIPAIPGVEGCNIYGEVVESKTGKDIKIRVQGEAEFNPEDNKITATKDGAMSVVKEHTIKVTAKVTIQGDINYKTGNLESENNTTIRGSVQEGFKVHVGGDLEIGGSVSSAMITCNGNAVFKGGITGKTARIEVDGDLDIKFIERGTLQAGGITVIRTQSYYSDIKSGLDIRCAPASTIMGGTLIAGGSLTVGNVGADNCEPAFLAAGVDPQRYKLYLELKEELAEQQNEIIKALQMSGSGSRPKKIRKMEEEAEETRIKVMKLNLIPGTELYSRIGSGKDREELDDEDPLYNDGIDIEKIRIEVVGKMYAGTTIMLGNRSAKLSEDVIKRRYRLSKNLKRIMAIPL